MNAMTDQSRQKCLPQHRHGQDEFFGRNAICLEEIEATVDLRLEFPDAKSFEVSRSRQNET